MNPLESVLGAASIKSPLAVSQNRMSTEKQKTRTQRGFFTGQLLQRCTHGFEKK